VGETVRPVDLLDAAHLAALVTNVPVAAADMPTKVNEG
jgi:hypothetical protein